ncbi:hypothetical protein HAX54_031829, partial [Datura stramonium]|nr:hypothetical protein [Datura stramonium]
METGACAIGVVFQNSNAEWVLDINDDSQQLVLLYTMTAPPFFECWVILCRATTVVGTSVATITVLLE